MVRILCIALTIRFLIFLYYSQWDSINLIFLWRKKNLDASRGKWWAEFLKDRINSRELRGENVQEKWDPKVRINCWLSIGEKEKMKGVFWCIGRRYEVMWYENFNTRQTILRWKNCFENSTFSEEVNWSMSH